jgi:nitrite reductase/ring-hydroxylating ferredoxin subunit/uncharacterized membrane protein
MLNLKIDDALARIPFLKQAGQTAASSIHSAVLAGGDPARQVADFLHGTWLGHPLHPVLTDVVVGSFSLGALFDFASVLGGGESTRKAADSLTVIGTAAAVPTALAGLADFSTIPRPAAAHGLVHGLANDVAITLYVFSLKARKRGNRRAGIALSTLGMAVLTAGAYLGGHLVFGKRVGVDHTMPASQSDEWQAVINERDLLERELTRVEVEGTGVVLYRFGETVLAVGANCPHNGAPLEEGTMDGYCVQCPWHDSVFDLRDGSIVHGPSTYPLPKYEARIRDERVEVRLAKPA